MVIDLRPSRRRFARPSAHRIDRLTDRLARRLKTAALAAMVGQLIPFGAHAQVVDALGIGGGARTPFRFGASLEVDETYSDNIGLAPPGAERSDLVTTIAPSLRVSRSAANLQFAADYTPQFLYYARGTSGSTVRNSFDASGRLTLVDNFLFVDGLATIGQSNISPFGTLAANTVNTSNNRAETRSYSIGPTLQSHYGRDLTYSAGLRYSGSNSNNNAYATSHTNQIFAQFENGTSYRDLGFGADINRTAQEYGGTNGIVEETAGVTLLYQLLPTFRLRGRVGYDRDSYPTTGQPDLKGVNYSGGFDWQPSQHTQFNAQVGHRYFGPTANISLRESTSKVALSVSYTRDQSTSSGNGIGLVTDPNYALFDQYFRTIITDPVLRQQAITAALAANGLPTSQFTAANFLSNQLFVQKAAQISLALLGRRNTVTFDASRVETQSLSALTTGLDIFNQTQHFRVTTYSANWSYRPGPRTSVNATAQRAHSQAIDGFGDTRQTVLTTSVTRQIGKSLSGTLLYRNTRQDGNGSNNALNSNFYSGAYRENAVLGSLRLTF